MHVSWRRCDALTIKDVDTTGILGRCDGRQGKPWGTFAESEAFARAVSSWFSFLTLDFIGGNSYLMSYVLYCTIPTVEDFVHRYLKVANLLTTFW
eukprot:scaffold2946_cov74-Skeletonema_dohrnii-CCMP3373.AAC.1